MFLGGLGFTEATGVTRVRGTVIRLFSPEGTLVIEAGPVHPRAPELTTPQYL
jgi:hypothetical protein